MTKKLMRKELVLINFHRQTLPIIRNKNNRSYYIFLNSTRIWKMIPFRGSKKIKFRLMYIILSIIHPKHIIDINWTTLYHALYKLWTKKHTTSTYIVIQHGAYIGGKIMDIGHRYTNCDEFLVWSSFFEKTFRNYNEGKRCKIRTFGNPVYNEINRNTLDYIETSAISKILVAPSVQMGYRMKKFYSLISLLRGLGFEVHLKQHNYQARKSTSFLGVKLISGNLAEILMKRNYDLIISDYSTSLLDAIFFKFPVLYFDPPDEDKEWEDTLYSNYLKNLAASKTKIENSEDLKKLINIPAQEQLLVLFVNEGHNVIDKR